MDCTNTQQIATCSAAHNTQLQSSQESRVAGDGTQAFNFKHAPFTGSRYATADQYATSVTPMSHDKS